MILSHRKSHYLSLILILLPFYYLVYVGDVLGSGDEIVRYLMTDNFLKGRGFKTEYTDTHGHLQSFWPEAPKYGYLHPLLASVLQFPKLLTIADSEPKSDILMVYDIPVSRRTLNCTLLFNPILATVLCCFYFRTGLLLKYPANASLISSLVLGLCTMIFAYTPLFFTELLTTLCLWLGFYFALRNSNYDAFWAAFCTGLVVNNNPVFLFSIPIIFFYIFLKGHRNSRPARVILYLSGLLPGMCFFFYQILVKEGFGYTNQPGFTNPFIVGLYGNLVSPGKSLFIFSPVAILGVFGIKCFIRKHRSETWLGISLTACLLVIYSKWSNWVGGTCWGPRLLLPAIPFIMLPQLEIFQSLKTKGCLMKAGVLLLCLISFYVQLTATLVPVYHWFHYASGHVRIEKLQFTNEHESNDKLLIFQLGIPYFPEYCPPLLHSRALAELIINSRFEELSPKWVKEGSLISLMMCSLCIAVGGYMAFRSCREKIHDPI